MVSNFFRDHCDDLRRPSARRRVLIHEIEALGARGMAVDCLNYLKQTQAEETNKLAALTKLLVETQAGIHEKEGHATNMDLND
nr:glycoside hydrolase, family 79 [Tanacetum cinerariifolium]